MTIIKRTCTNCAAFNSDPVGNEPTCWNLVSITGQHSTQQVLTREHGPNDNCDNHLTHAESLEQTAYIDVHRDVIVTQKELPEWMTSLKPFASTGMKACTALPGCDAVGM